MDEKLLSNPLYDVQDICMILGISKSKGYAIIKQLNEELKQEGFITISGKVSKKYFQERIAL